MAAVSTRRMRGPRLMGCQPAEVARATSLASHGCNGEHDGECTSDEAGLKTRGHDEFHSASSRPVLSPSESWWMSYLPRRLSSRLPVGTCFCG